MEPFQHNHDYTSAISNITKCKQQQCQRKCINDSTFNSEFESNIRLVSFYIANPPKLSPPLPISLPSLTHTRIHICIHVRTHTHTCTHTQICLLKRIRNNDQSSSNEYPISKTQIYGSSNAIFHPRNDVSLEKQLILPRQEHLIVPCSKEAMRDNQSYQRKLGANLKRLPTC